MKIEIDLELLEELNLNPNEYLCLHSKHKGIDLPQLLVDSFDYKYCIEHGWMDEDWQVTDKWLDLFAADFDELFKELIETYPAIVESPGRGKRVLHAKDPGALSNMKAKNKYRKITGEKVHVHNKIMQLLKVQLSQGGLGYLQNLETWLNNYTWEKYVDMDLKDENNGRITRSL